MLFNLVLRNELAFVVCSSDAFLLSAVTDIDRDADGDLSDQQHEVFIAFECGFFL
jgi:hypothetical protein